MTLELESIFPLVLASLVQQAGSVMDQLHAHHAQLVKVELDVRLASCPQVYATVVHQETCSIFRPEFVHNVNHSSILVAHQT